MPEKESVEDKIARIVRETMAGERQRAEDEKDPAVGRLRRIVREEVGSVLGDLLKGGEGEGGGRKRAPRQQADDDEDTSIASLLGFK